jgi:hypothetical protein
MKAEKEERPARKINSNPTKRYLILTQEGDFEKVHYPLPLNFIVITLIDLYRMIQMMKLWRE